MSGTIWPGSSTTCILWFGLRSAQVGSRHTVRYIPRPAAGSSYTEPHPIRLFFQESTNANRKAIALGLTECARSLENSTSSKPAATRSAASTTICRPAACRSTASMSWFPRGRSSSVIGRRAPTRWRTLSSGSVTATRFPELALPSPPGSTNEFVEWTPSATSNPHACLLELHRGSREPDERAHSRADNLRVRVPRVGRPASSSTLTMNLLHQ